MPMSCCGMPLQAHSEDCYFTTSAAPGSMSFQDSPSQLLELPDACLTAVLRCLSQDQTSLLNAAQSHSRLHALSRSVLTSVTGCFKQQRQVDSLLLYLSSQGQNTSSVSVQCMDTPGDLEPMSVLELPAGLKLRSLQLEGACVQLCAGSGRGGVLEACAGTTLTQLQLWNYSVRDADGPTSLATALQQLPNLQHLELGIRCWPIWPTHIAVDTMHSIPNDALQHLQGLTHLHLDLVVLDSESPHLQVQALSNLRALVLHRADRWSRMPQDLLANMPHLTLVDFDCCSNGCCEELPSRIFAGKAKIQHISLMGYYLGEFLGSGPREFLCDLQQLTELTHLKLHDTLEDCEALPASSFAALTASSSLQCLQVYWADMPPDAWQYIFSAGRQLPQLQNVAMYCIEGLAMGAAEMSSLVRACPNLHTVYMEPGSRGTPWQGNPAEVLAPLCSLASLRDLSAGGMVDDAALMMLAQLTGLTALSACAPLHTRVTAAGLLPLIDLRQLNSVRVVPLASFATINDAGVEDPSADPVWRQVLQWCLEKNVPGAAEAAACAQSGKTLDSDAWYEHSNPNDP